MYYDGVTCKSKVGRGVPKSNLITVSLTMSVFHQLLQLPEIAVIYQQSGRGFTALS